MSPWPWHHRTSIYQIYPRAGHTRNADDFYNGETVLSPFGGVILKRRPFHLQRTLKKATRLTSMGQPP